MEHKINLTQLAANINKLETRNRARAKKNILYLNNITISFIGNEVFFNAARFKFKNLRSLLSVLVNDGVLYATNNEIEILSSTPVKTGEI